MSDESYSFSTARARLEEIVTQVRKKDTSLEKSLDLLEEGVRLANSCTELIDHADWTVGGVGEAEAADGVAAGGPADGAEPGEGVAGEPESDVLAETTQSAAVPEEAENAENDPVEGADDEFAPDDDAFGDAAQEAWADDTPEYRDDEA
jgi:exodeoxyribonuclease VII small subunit